MQAASVHSSRAMTVCRQLTAWAGTTIKGREPELRLEPWTGVPEMYEGMLELQQRAIAEAYDKFFKDKTVHKQFAVTNWSARIHKTTALYFTLPPQSSSSTSKGYYIYVLQVDPWPSEDSTWRLDCQAGFKQWPSGTEAVLWTQSTSPAAGWHRTLVRRCSAEEYMQLEHCSFRKAALPPKPSSSDRNSSSKQALSNLATRHQRYQAAVAAAEAERAGMCRKKALHAWLNAVKGRELRAGPARKLPGDEGIPRTPAREWRMLLKAVAASLERGA